MCERLQHLSLSVPLAQMVLGISCLLGPSAIASPIPTTSPQDRANTPQEIPIFSDRLAPEAPKYVVPDESVAQVTGAPSSLEALKGVPTSLEALEPTEVSPKKDAIPITDIPDRGASTSARDLRPSENSPAIVAQTESTYSLSTAKEPVADKSAAPDTQKLAKAAQNPIANLISVPFQNNFNFGVGPYDRTQYVLNIQPVIPISLNKDWLLVARIITPILIQPTGTTASTFGLGDLNPSFFFVPKSSGDLTWGVGPVFSLATATDPSLGTGKWNIGPTAVVVWMPGQWVVGLLANQQWSVAGDSSRPDVSQFLAQPFINYNLPDSWYLSSAPIITANWNASSGNQWTVPFGGGFGRIFRIGKQPVNATLQAYWNVIKPEFAADWQIRFQLALLFPTGG